MSAQDPTAAEYAVFMFDLIAKMIEDPTEPLSDELTTFAGETENSGLALVIIAMGIMGHYAELLAEVTASKADALQVAKMMLLEATLDFPDAE